MSNSFIVSKVGPLNLFIATDRSCKPAADGFAVHSGSSWVQFCYKIRSASVAHDGLQCRAFRGVPGK